MKPTVPARIARHVRGLATGSAIVVSALLAAMLPACDARTGNYVGPSQTESTIAGEPVPTFLARIHNAPWRVRYGGLRRVLVQYTVAGTPSTLEHEEQVYSDGRGSFAIVPGTVIQPAMSDEERQLFALLQAGRDGFFYRFRDFGIRDVRLFLRNWSATDTGNVEVVAGIPASELEFHRIQPLPSGQTWYRAWIEPSTGLVLRSEERTDSGQLVSRMEFVTFTWTPDTTGVTLHGDRYTRTRIDLDNDTAATLGFQVRAPTILPEGYRLERAESTELGPHTWAILTYSDGLDQVFYLQSEDVPGPGGQVMTADVELSRAVRGFRVGPWTVLQGEFPPTLAIVLGKTDEASLLEMLRSSVQ